MNKKTETKENKEVNKIKRMSEILTHIKLRVKALGAILDYYDSLDRQGLLWKSDDMMAYTIAQAQMNELERLVKYIENIGE